MNVVFHFFHRRSVWRSMDYSHSSRLHANRLSACRYSILDLYALLCGKIPKIHDIQLIIISGVTKHWQPATLLIGVLGAITASQMTICGEYHVVIEQDLLNTSTGASICWKSYDANWFDVIRWKLMQKTISFAFCFQRIQFHLFLPILLSNKRTNERLSTIIDNRCAHSTIC